MPQKKQLEALQKKVNTTLAGLQKESVALDKLNRKIGGLAAEAEKNSGKLTARYRELIKVVAMLQKMEADERETQRGRITLPASRKALEDAMKILKKSEEENQKRRR